MLNKFEYNGKYTFLILVFVFKNYRQSKRHPTSYKLLKVYTVLSSIIIIKIQPLKSIIIFEKTCIPKPKLTI